MKFYKSPFHVNHDYETANRMCKEVDGKMNNPWRKFCDEIPKECLGLDLKGWFDATEDGASEYVKDEGLYTPEGFIPEEELSESYEEWRYDQDGWLFPEEVTGEEGADYWLIAYKDGSVKVLNYSELPLESAIFKLGVALAAKPMKYQQAPKWVIEKWLKGVE